MYVVVDLETTGLSREFHEIIEIAAVRLQNGTIVEEFHSMVKPKQKIPSNITSFTGITNDMVVDAPNVDVVLGEFFAFLKQDCLIAHNAQFDYGFLSARNRKTVQVEFGNQVLCTRKLANRVIPLLKSKSLGSLCEHFDVKNLRAHRAMADVQATVQIFQKMTQQLELDRQTPENLCTLQNIPRKRLPSGLFV